MEIHQYGRSEQKRRRALESKSFILMVDWGNSAWTPWSRQSKNMAGREGTGEDERKAWKTEENWKDKMEKTKLVPFVINYVMNV